MDEWTFTCEGITWALTKPGWGYHRGFWCWRTEEYGGAILHGVQHMPESGTLLASVTLDGPLGLALLVAGKKTASELFEAATAFLKKHRKKKVYQG